MSHEVEVKENEESQKELQNAFAALKALLEQLNGYEANPRNLRELLEKLLTVTKILSEANPNFAADDLVPTLQEQLNIKLVSGDIDKLNEFNELLKTMRGLTGLSDNKKMIEGGEYLLVTLMGAVGGDLREINPETRARLFNEAILELLNDGKKVIEELGDQCPVEIKNYLETFPKKADEVSQKKIHEIVLRLYAEYRKALDESDLSQALGESLIYVLGIDNEEIKNEKDPSKKKELIVGECRQYVLELAAAREEERKQLRDALVENRTNQIVNSEEEISAFLNSENGRGLDEGIKKKLEEKKVKELDQNQSSIFSKAIKKYISNELGVALTSEEDRRFKQGLRDILNHLEKGEITEKSSRELIDKFKVLQNILVKAMEDSGQELAADDFYFTLRYHLKQFRELKPEVVNNLNELIELAAIISENEEYLAHNDLKLNKQTIKSIDIYSVSTPQMVFGSLCEEALPVSEETKDRLKQQYLLAEMNVIKAGIQEADFKQEVKDELLNHFPKGPNSLLNDDQKYKLTAALYDQYKLIEDSASPLSLAVEKSLISLLKIRQEELFKFDSKTQKVEAVDSKKVIINACQFIENDRQIAIAKENERLNKERARLEQDHINTISEYKPLGIWETAQFQVSLFWNKLRGKEKFPQSSVITPHIILGRIPEIADATPGNLEALPEGFGEGDMVVAVVNPGEMLQVNDHAYFEALKKKGIKHHSIPMKDFGSDVNPLAAQKTLAEMHKTLSAGKKVYTHCKAGRARSAMMLASLLTLVAKDYLANKETNPDKKYPGYEAFIDRLKNPIFYLMPNFPKNPEKYKNSYILVGEELRYIGFDGKLSESLDLVNKPSFMEEVSNLKKKLEEKIAESKAPAGPQYSTDIYKLPLAERQLEQLIYAHSKHRPDGYLGNEDKFPDEIIAGFAVDFLKEKRPQVDVDKDKRTVGSFLKGVATYIVDSVSNLFSEKDVKLNTVSKGKMSTVLEIVNGIELKDLSNKEYEINAKEKIIQSPDYKIVQAYKPQNANEVIQKQVAQEIMWANIVASKKPSQGERVVLAELEAGNSQNHPLSVYIENRLKLLEEVTGQREFPVGLKEIVSLVIEHGAAEKEAARFPKKDPNVRNPIEEVPLVKNQNQIPVGLDISQANVKRHTFGG